jgi:prephenate dehydratase
MLFQMTPNILAKMLIQLKTKQIKANDIHIRPTNYIFCSNVIYLFIVDVLISATNKTALIHILSNSEIVKH